MTKTPGVEQFEYLSDKSSLFIYMLEDEAKALDRLRDDVQKLRDENLAVAKLNKELVIRAARLEEKREEIDTKAGVLLTAIDEARIS